MWYKIVTKIIILCAHSPRKSPDTIFTIHENIHVAIANVVAMSGI